MDTRLLAQYEQLEQGNLLMKKLPYLKLVIFDVDGVLTDGGLLYGAHGEELKRFNVKDGVALKLLPQWGVEVAVITAKDSAPLRKRMTDLGVKHVYYGCHDKAAAFAELMATLALEPEQVAYVGDDVIDLQVMPKIGISMCPNDAHTLLLRHCDITLKRAGGQGVAREVADLVLATRMSLEAAYELAQRPEFEKKDN
ncbi:KdsC family phosphatase [Marinomonas ostreistagni]|uniref:KdsC family phosphatase n=1 Tax=Marinomonas ostreistagni TaxID=359209 RepID=UPI00194EA491|nr:HAD-IIIA family hydrolase [Marinomonas ostreistagni]MBM6551573.1 HAD-IIIA family hydrolase [Marinomonas ostreistagni]